MISRVHSRLLRHIGSLQRRPHDTVAPGALGLVERGICRGEEVEARLGACRQRRRPAHADRQRKLQPAGRWHALRLDVAACGLGQRLRPLHGDAGEQDHELLAAVATDEVGRAAQGL
ncbi:hypothetical protein RZS08_09585, partial [Arthrospira platensis SPKY1]|nr:hypothetical protein [Arthrospira platensis SPKY1]